jgi:wobble nucleotide-excising tRNase
MRITRIKKVKDHRIFRDFTWPASLQCFVQFNVIYGWNGSGKTTLASLLRHLENRTAVLEGEVSFEIDENFYIQGSALTAASPVPQVRVFNRDFIASAIDKRLDGIYYFGEDSVEKQKQVELLRTERTEADGAVLRAQTVKSVAESALDSYCIQRAQTIKEVLISSRSTKYNNYDKRLFRRAIEGLDEESALALPTSEEKESLRKQKDAQPKKSVAEVAIDIPDFVNLLTRTDELLRRSVVSHVLEELSADSVVSSWVQRGLTLHSGDRTTNVCRFCGQPLLSSRVEGLEAHFNDAFKTFQAEVCELAQQVSAQGVALSEARFPDPSGLYDFLAKEMESVVSDAGQLLHDAVAFLESVHAILRRKGESPFEHRSMVEVLEGTSVPDRSALEQAINAVNGVIKRHNTTTDDFQNQIDRACEALEKCFVAEAFAEYRRLDEIVTSTSRDLESFAERPKKLNDQIATIERDVVDNLRPAEELNHELHVYLGHDDLCFEVIDSGYAMSRGGRPANDLSEGERTAIAFLYFLKSLKDRSFDLANGVVIVDDPVSSLDANSLFSAFAYMKDRCIGAGQLIVLTHNFTFFRQVRNWFRELPGQRKKNLELRPARFYLLTASVRAGQRSASIGPIDAMLETYESEYHYLFKCVFEGGHREDTDVMLERCYGMPNVGRRLLEAFLAFRAPGVAGKLSKKVEALDFDYAKKTRILRFLQTYSHLDSVSDPEHDPSVLAETKPVLCALLELVEALDPDHYHGMLEAIGITPDDVEEQ